MKKILFAILCITLSNVSVGVGVGDNPDIIIRGNVGEYREAGPGDKVNQHMEIHELGKKYWPTVTNAPTVAMSAKTMKELLSKLPIDLLIGELAQRGIIIEGWETSACGGPDGSEANQASKKKPTVSKCIFKKMPLKPAKESMRPH